MDKDVQVRLAAIEDKVDLLLRQQVQKPVEYVINFSTDTVDDEEICRRLGALCTNPPIRGD